MTSRTLSKKVLHLVDAEMKQGDYASTDDVLLKAMEALVEQRQAVEGIRRGFAAYRAGKVLRREESDRQFRRKNRLPKK